MPTTAIKLIPLLLLAWASAGYAETEAEPEWRRGINNKWCIQFADKETCLPDGVEVTRFEPDHAWWHSVERFEHVLQIRYDAEVPQYDDSLLASQCLVLRSSFGYRDVLATELATEPNEETSRYITMFVIVFDDKFAITLSGTDPDRMRNIASSLIEQWSPYSG